MAGTTTVVRWMLLLLHYVLYQSMHEFARGTVAEVGRGPRLRTGRERESTKDRLGTQIGDSNRSCLDEIPAAAVVMRLRESPRCAHDDLKNAMIMPVGMQV